MPIYSLGINSPIKFELTRNFAENYNNAILSFFEAQEQYEDDHGYSWNPEEEPLEVHLSEAEHHAFNEFQEMFRKALRNKEYKKYSSEEILQDECLVEN